MKSSVQGLLFRGTDYYTLKQVLPDYSIFRKQAVKVLEPQKNSCPWPSVLVYYNEEDRETLREQIVSELIYLERLDDDEKIKLGFGGARPKEVKRDKTALIITGPPASGKSKVASVKVTPAMGLPSLSVFTNS